MHSLCGIQTSPNYYIVNDSRLFSQEMTDGKKVVDSFFFLYISLLWARGLGRKNVVAKLSY